MARKKIENAPHMTPEQIKEHNTKLNASIVKMIQEHPDMVESWLLSFDSKQQSAPDPENGRDYFRLNFVVALEACESRLGVLDRKQMVILFIDPKALDGGSQ